MNTDMPGFRIPTVILFCLFLNIEATAHSASMRSESTLITIQRLLTTFERYYLDHGHYPPPATWEYELRRKDHPDGGPYIRDRAYLDSWGKPFVFEIHETAGGPIPIIYSTGADGISNSRGHDPDDIASWMEKVSAPEYQQQPWWRSSIDTPILALISLVLLGFGSGWVFQALKAS